MNEQTIVKVWKNKGNGQLLATIPRDKYKEGDYLEIRLVSSQE